MGIVVSVWWGGGGRGGLVVVGCGETKAIKGAKFKENIRTYETKHCFAVSRNNSKLFFSYFRFFSFAKLSKLGETVTCFVQFCISRN